MALWLKNTKLLTYIRLFCNNSGRETDKILEFIYQIQDKINKKDLAFKIETKISKGKMR